MLERILVPTDGSELSERALAAAETLALAQQATMFLVRVVELPWWSNLQPDDPGTVDLYAEADAALTAAASGALDQLADRYRDRLPRVQTSLLHGRAASELLGWEQREQPDLVVMATHGRTGLARFAVGSVADRLIRAGSSPVLLVRSFSPEISPLERVLIPVDGSETAEQVFPMVEALAGSPFREVKLLRVVASEPELVWANAYLGSLAMRTQSAGLDTSWEARVGIAGDVIDSEARAFDLVAMVTHGMGGFKRWQHGSVAERAARDLPTPLLLVRAKDDRRDP